MCLLSLALVLLLLLPGPSFATKRKSSGAAYKPPSEDPYKVLGIKFRDRKNLETIKKAYHQKAKDHHPDKNPDMDPAKANDNFRRIVDAWEFLSDPGKKRTYDLLGNQKQQRMTQSNTNRKQTMYQHYSFTQSSHGSHNQRQQMQQQKQKSHQKNDYNNYRQQNSRTQILFDARLAQQRVVKFSSLEQLQSTLLDRDQRFKKHFFCVFVANKKIEHFVDDELLFPYPFGPKGRNEMDWGTLLQTAKVRYNSATTLTQAFRVPQRSSKPHIVFCKNGDRIDECKVYQRSFTYDKVEHWVLEQLKSLTTIVNFHHSEVRVFLDTNVRLKSMGANLPPGHQITIQAAVGDRVVIVDGNVDQYAGAKEWQDVLFQQNEIQNAVTLNSVLVKETQQEIEVGPGYGSTRRCYDLSLRCHHWAQEKPRKGQLPNCKAQLEFAHNMCPYSCGVCIDSSFNGVYYTLFHLPLHKVPSPISPVLSGLRSTAKFGGVFFEDLNHILQIRRNVTVAFVLAGFLAGVQIVLFGHFLISDRSAPSSRVGDHSFLGFIILLAICMAAWGIWMSQALPNQVPHLLRGFHKDLLHMESKSMDAVYGLLYLGFLSLVLSKKISQPRQPGPRRSNNRLIFLVALVSISTLMILGTSHVLRNDILVSGKKNHRYTRWNDVWKLRKNVAMAIFVFGCVLGSCLMSIGDFLRQFRWSTNVTLSLVNVGLGAFGIALALQDRYFLKDLHHVLSMRMSAAIPCALLGMMWGVSLAHILTTYQVKLKVD